MNTNNNRIIVGYTDSYFFFWGVQKGMGHNETFGMFCEEEIVCWKSLQECHSRNNMLSVAIFLGFETATNSLRKIKFSPGSCLVWELKLRNKGWIGMPFEHVHVRLWDCETWLITNCGCMRLIKAAALLFFRRCGIWDLDGFGFYFATGSFLAILL